MSSKLEIIMSTSVYNSRLSLWQWRGLSKEKEGATQYQELSSMYNDVLNSKAINLNVQTALFPAPDISLVTLFYRTLSGSLQSIILATQTRGFKWGRGKSRYEPYFLISWAYPSSCPQELCVLNNSTRVLSSNLCQLFPS